LRSAYITLIPGNYECDVKFPMRDLSGGVTERPDGSSPDFVTEYIFTNSEENAYLALLGRLIIAPLRSNRTGIPTRGLFHEVLKFTLHDEQRGAILPLLTTKAVYWRAVYHELIWFLRGSTDTAYLRDNKIRIWDGNSTREYLDSRGLVNYDEGEVGPVYGYQWRHWGADYGGRRSDGGIDQLAAVIETLKRDPFDRRMVVSAWNPSQISEMALPPCHYSFQFHVSTAGGDAGGDTTCVGAPTYLNCLVNMRSADIALGVPFNIASYALLTHMVAKIVGLTPGTLSISIADCHLYTNHIEAVHEMTARSTRRFPVLRFSPAIETAENLTIDDFAYNFGYDDFIVEGYAPHPAIKMDMAV
jgi:thymidylate synthase